MYFPIDKKLVIHFFSRIMYVKVKFSWFFSSSKVEILACDYKELEKKKKKQRKEKSCSRKARISMVTSQFQMQDLMLPSSKCMRISLCIYCNFSLKED